MNKSHNNFLKPSEKQLVNLLELYKTGRYLDAEKLAISITQEFPQHQFTLKLLTATLRQNGKIKEALIVCQKTVKLFPLDAEVHSNLGVLLRDLGRLGESCSAFFQAINLNPNFDNAYTNLSIVIKDVRFNSSNIKLYAPLIKMLSNGNFVRPNDIAHSIVSLLKHDPLIKNLLLEKNFPSSIKELYSTIGNLHKLKLLHLLMRLCPLPDLQIERYFKALRSLILINLNDIEESPELIYFLSTLSIHCFTNEYIYIEKSKEIELVKNLENEIFQIFEQSEQPKTKKILCLASYRPLHKYNWCQKLDTLNNLQEVKSRLIEEPYTEKEIFKEIPKLKKVSDDVSQKVRAQYEENPYPRWVKTGIPTTTKSISDICFEANLDLHSKSIKNIIAPEILIAGCGTGQHSIVAASHFSNCQITAVDLSLASIAYAKRKSTELGITNLKYLQADILNLDQLQKKFDIIESVGVLHHMDDPMLGWEILTKLLRPGGLMKIGLYSELGRQHILKIRNEIKSMKIGTSKIEITDFRQHLAESNKEHHRQLTKSSEFYSLSMLRDLIFHVQEHRFTLLQIKKCLDKLGLKFCGFTNKKQILNFREFYRKDEDICDLALWHQYENSNPNSFAGMYQFWCQKK